MNSMKKNQAMISIDTENNFVKFQHALIIKVLERTGLKETYIKKIKATYKKLTANIINIILNGEKLKANH